MGRKLPLAFFMLALSPCSYAAIYRCTINGVETFSQTPCARNAQTVSVIAQSGHSSASTPVALTPAQPMVGSAGEIGKLDRQIADRERWLADATARFRSSFGQLRNAKPSDLGKAPGQEWESELMQRLTATQQTYEKEIKRLTQELAHLNAKRMRLRVKDEPGHGGAIDTLHQQTMAAERQRLEQELASHEQARTQQLSQLDVGINYAGQVGRLAHKLEKRALRVELDSQEAILKAQIDVLESL